MALRPDHRAAADPRSSTAWVVTVLNGPGGALAVVDPTGMTPGDHPARHRVSHAASADVQGEPLTWAWGRIDPDAPTPRVWFRSRTALRWCRADVRRLSPTVWAAQAPGRWPRIRLR